METKKIGMLRAVVSDTISKLNDEERGVVIEWAQYSKGVVSDESLSKKEKFLRLKEVSSAPPVLALLKALARLLKSKAWDDQSWARRLGIVGLATGLATFGWEAAGIAAMGSAVGVPLALITATGATILGVVIDELNKEVKERKSK